MVWSAAKDHDSVFMVVELFLGGPAGDADISAKASRSKRTTYEIK